MRPTEARRSFMARLGAGATAVGAMFATGGSRAQAQPTSPAWQPARHSQDDWLDQLPGKHRCFFDTTTVDALVDAILFAGNYYNVNKNTYGHGDTASWSSSSGFATNRRRSATTTRSGRSMAPRWRNGPSTRTP